METFFTIAMFVMFALEVILLFSFMVRNRQEAIDKRLYGAVAGSLGLASIISIVIYIIASQNNGIVAQPGTLAYIANSLSFYFLIMGFYFGVDCMLVSIMLGTHPRIES